MLCCVVLCCVVLCCVVLCCVVLCCVVLCCVVLYFTNYSPICLVHLTSLICLNESFLLATKLLSPVIND